MAIKFNKIDECTFKCTTQLALPRRGTQPPDKRKFLTKREIGDAFKQQYPDYIIESVTGPNKISNFISLEKSKGTWVFKVSPNAPQTKPKPAQTKPKPVKAKPKAPQIKTKPAQTKSKKKSYEELYTPSGASKNKEGA